jgi:predicted RNA-binding Zn-ribbon protein involved in translation (DUF1610 family)
MYCTDPETLIARKPHRCMSCGELVNPGEHYLRWRCYDSGEVGTVKMHPECHAMHCEDARGMGGGPWEFTPYSHERPKRDCGEAGHDEGRCGNASCLVA